MQTSETCGCWTWWKPLNYSDTGFCQVAKCRSNWPFFWTLSHVIHTFWQHNKNENLLNLSAHESNTNEWRHTNIYSPVVKFDGINNKLAFCLRSIDTKIKSMKKLSIQLDGVNLVKRKTFNFEWFWVKDAIVSLLDAFCTRKWTFRRFVILYWESWTISGYEKFSENYRKTKNINDSWSKKAHLHFTSHILKHLCHVECGTRVFIQRKCTK